MGMKSLQEYTEMLETNLKCIEPNRDYSKFRFNKANKALRRCLVNTVKQMYDDKYLKNKVVIKNANDFIEFRSPKGAVLDKVYLGDRNECTFYTAINNVYIQLCSRNKTDYTEIIEALDSFKLVDTIYRGILVENNELCVSKDDLSRPSNYELIQLAKLMKEDKDKVVELYRNHGYIHFPVTKITVVNQVYLVPENRCKYEIVNFTCNRMATAEEAEKVIAKVKLIDI